MLRQYLTLAMVLLLLGVVFAGLAQADERPEVAVSIGSVGSIVREVLGKVAVVVSVLPDGADPHSYSLTQGDYETASSADMIVYASTDEFHIEEELLNKFPDKPYTDFSDYTGYGAELHEISNLGVSYHAYWLYPENAVAVAKAVAQRFSELYPAYEETVMHSLSEFESRVASITPEYSGKVVVAVPGASYMSEALGFEVSATLMKGPNVFVQGSELDDIIRSLSSGDAKYIVCPTEFIGTGVEDMALKVSSESGAGVVYIKIFTGSLNYTDLVYYDMGSASMPAESEGPDVTSYIVVVAILVIAVAVEGIYIYRRWR